MRAAAAVQMLPHHAEGAANAAGIGSEIKRSAMNLERVVQPVAPPGKFAFAHLMVAGETLIFVRHGGSGKRGTENRHQSAIARDIQADLGIGAMRRWHRRPAA